MIRDWASHILMRDLVFCKRVTCDLLEGYYDSKIFMHSDSHSNSCRVQVFFVRFTYKGNGTNKSIKRQATLYWCRVQNIQTRETDALDMYTSTKDD